jgi:hypothetical protein
MSICDVVFDTVGGDVTMRSSLFSRRAGLIGPGAQAPKPNANAVTSLRLAVGPPKSRDRRLAPAA